MQANSITGHEKSSLSGLSPTQTSAGKDRALSFGYALKEAYDGKANSRTQECAEASVILTKREKRMMELRVLIAQIEKQLREKGPDRELEEELAELKKELYYLMFNLL